MLGDRNLQQMVEEPTREKDTLNLIAVSTPVEVNKIDVILGISNHNRPLTEFDVTPNKE